MPIQEPEQTRDHQRQHDADEAGKTRNPYLSPNRLLDSGFLRSSGFAGDTAVFFKMLAMEIANLDKQRLNL